MQMLIGNLFAILKLKMSGDHARLIKLVSKELNPFGVMAGLVRQIGGHSSRFVLFCSFCILHEIQTPGINMQNGLQVI